MKSIHSLHSYPFCSLATNHLQFMFIRASACNWNERKLVLYMSLILSTAIYRILNKVDCLPPHPQHTLPPSHNQRSKSRKSKWTPNRRLQWISPIEDWMKPKHLHPLHPTPYLDSQLLPPISFSNNSKNNQSEGDVTPVSFNSSAHPRQVFLIFHRIGFAPSLRDFSQSMASRREIIYISDYSSPDSHGRSRLTIIQSRRNHKRRQRHRERWPLPLPINIDGECGICLETYREDNMIVTLMCHHHHHFHRHCIDVGCKQERVAQFVGELLKYHWEWEFLEDW